MCMCVTRCKVLDVLRGGGGGGGGGGGDYRDILPKTTTNLTRFLY